MSEIHDCNDTAMQELFRAARPNEVDPGLRRRLLERTTRVVRRRRRVRHAIRGLTMAACYFAGVATMYLLVQRSLPSQPGPIPSETIAETNTRPNSASLESSSTTRQEQPDRFTLTEDLPASALEELARIVPDDEVRETYRRAGDRYIQQLGDLASALRCYREVLAGSGPEEIVISENDTWLLASLKQARLEEFRHAIN